MGVTVAVVVGSTVVSVLAAYAFARLEFWGRDILFVALLSGLMLPVQIAAVPEFIEVKYLGLLNSQLSLIIPALIQVFGIFLLREHFKTIPRELEEAARIEGAGELQILRLVVVPALLARHLAPPPSSPPSTYGTTSSGPTSTSPARAGWSRRSALSPCRTPI